MKESGRVSEKIGADRSQQGRKDQTVGQGRGERDQLRQSEKAQDKSSAKQKDQTVGQNRGERDQTRQSEQQGRDKNSATTQDRNTKEGTTTGANTKPGNTAAQGQNAQQGQGTTTGANTRDQTNTQAQNQGAAQSMSGRVSVTAQQQTRLQQSVLNSRNVARVSASSINFGIRTGVFVPRNFAVVSVAAFPALIDIYPDFRDDSFFVVDDDIVVLDRSRRIVDVVPAGPRARYARGSSMSGSSVAALDLSPAEIRVVQQVLIDQGLLTGTADGVLGTRTHEALMVFQRQQGIRATGSIDTNTVAALGVSNKISATQGQSSTVGQGRDGQQPAAPQNTTGQNAGQGQPNAPAQQNQPATTGQAGTQPPSGQTTGQAGAQQPSGQTTGQAPPAQGNNPPSANQDAPSGQTNQNNAPAPSASQPSQNQPSR